MVTCFLVDNGSLRAASTLNLRRIAHELAAAVRVRVEPVSLLHSHKVDPLELEGEPAKLLATALRENLENRGGKCLVIPLFFGPSRALTRYLPRVLSKIRLEFPDADISVAPPLFDLGSGVDFRLAGILRDHVCRISGSKTGFPVILLDHGTPEPEVTHVRNFIAGQLSVLLEGRAGRVRAASMERRPGDEYSFSGPLLEEVLGQEGFNTGEVVVAMLFLSPGRHAGEGGDVEKICRAAEKRYPGLIVRTTALVGGHPLLISILADRVRALMPV